MQQSVHYLKTLFLALTLLLSFKAYSQLEQIHYFNFNENTPPSNTNWAQPIAATIGSGQLTYTFTEAYSFTGTTVNGNPGEVNGGSFVPRGGSETVNNGEHFVLSIPTTGYENIMLTYATQRTSTGFDLQTVEYTVDGTDWIEIATIDDIPSSFGARSVDLSSISGANDNADFAVRFILTGATSAAGNNRFDNISVSGAPAGMALSPYFIPDGGTFFEPVDVVIETVTPDADIFYSTVSDDGPWTAYSDVVTVDETTTIWAYAAADGLSDSNVASATFTFPEVTEVATLAALRDMPADGSYYHYTGEAVIVAMDSYHNRKFIQDETAAILLYDQPGVITTPYDLYDVITDVFGHLNLSSNMLRFHPATNTPPAVTNTPADPYVFDLDEVTADDQAKLVQFMNVSFVNTTDGQVFANGNNYTISDGEEEFTLRTDFWNVDYIGDPIPVEPVNISGVILQHMETLQLIPRFAADFEPYVEEPDPDPEQFTVTFVVKDAAGNDINDAVIVLNDVAYDAGHYVFELEEGTLVEYSVSYPCSADVSGEFEVTEDVEVNVIMAGIAGDANGDGVVDILDVISIVNYYTMTDTDIPCFDNADVNNDDKINVLDLILTVNIFAKGSQ